MAGLCSTTCGVNAPPTPYDAACITTTAYANGEYFFFVACEFTLDINDPAAVAAAITSGDLVISPRGKVVRGDSADVTQDDAFGCGEDLILRSETTIDYTTPIATPDSTADNVYWKNINDNYSSYRFGWVDCNGKVFYQAGDDNPGFKFTLGSKFVFTEETDGIGNWRGQVIIDHLEDIDVIYNPAVVAALGVSV